MSSIKNLYYLGVCDGHGINGHHASDYIKKHLHLNLEIADGGKLRKKAEEPSIFVQADNLTKKQ